MNISNFTPKDTPKYAFIDYQKIRSAATALSCTHGESIDHSTLFIGYETYHSESHFWSWFGKNLRIGIPLLFGILVGTSYVIFDPIRVFFMENSITHEYDFKKYYLAFFRWFNVGFEKIVSTFAFGKRDLEVDSINATLENWSDRLENFKKLSLALQEIPENIVLVAGPTGSGKSDLVAQAVKSRKYKLYIDCDAVINDIGRNPVASLAQQINYFPSFARFSSLSGLADSLISAATGAKIGQGKDSVPGFGSSTESEMWKMLDTLTLSLMNIAQRQTIGAVEYPIVIIENYFNILTPNAGITYSVLKEWAASLMELKICHIVFVSDQPSANFALLQAHKTKPIDLYTLTDAKAESAIAFLQKMLESYHVSTKDYEFCFEKIGGRLRDLEALVAKVKAGQSPMNAVNDLVSRAAAEITKIGFQNPKDSEWGIWSPSQFWTLVKSLSKNKEVAFDSIKMHSLFKGDSAPLFAMERAGLITIYRDQGREVFISPGKPLYRTAFQLLRNDPFLSASMEIGYLKERIAKEESKLLAYESEMKSLLESLRRIEQTFSWSWYRSDAEQGIQDRIVFLGKEIQLLSKKVRDWQGLIYSYKHQLKFSE
jgi:hypothetical protein